MIDWLQQLDYTILLTINGAHSPFLDTIMWWISNKFVWFPFYLFLFVLVYLKYSLKHAIWFTVIGFAAVGLCDYTTTFIFKENVMRLRPSHNPLLEDKLHFYMFKPGEFYKGGMYGFFSGHASNSTVITLLFGWQLKSHFKNIFYFLFIWLILVCYSRMYLGVHYPSDILCGILWGTLMSFLFYTLYKKIILRKN